MGTWGHGETTFASTSNTVNMSTVHVKGISSQTSEKEIRDFFSFCGKIQSLSVTPESSDANSTQSASVTFEKETAAKTALLLDNTQLGPAQVSVSSAKSLEHADWPAHSRVLRPGSEASHGRSQRSPSPCRSQERKVCRPNGHAPTGRQDQVQLWRCHRLLPMRPRHLRLCQLLEEPG